MATRAQVKIQSKELECPIYLYQHYNGDKLFKKVVKAIERKVHWDDYEYLSRIIFTEMLKGTSLDSNYDFGISTSIHGDINYLITVDTDNKTITEAAGLGKNMTVVKTLTFSDACNISTTKST